MLFFAAAFAWRDSLTLKALDVLAVLALLALASIGARGVRMRLAGITNYALGLIVAGCEAVFGVFPLLFGDISWKEIPRKGWSKHALAVARGLFIAAPLVLVFGALLTAADAIFEGIVRHTFALDIDLVLTHVFLTAFLAWATGGFLRGMLFGTAKAVTNPWRTLLETTGFTAGMNSPVSIIAGASTTVVDEKKSEGGAGQSESAGSESADDAPSAPAGGNVGPGRGARPFSLGVVEIGVALGLVNVLFFWFVAVQVRYFFGGAEWVVNSSGLTYAEYARRGFFELVWVAALVLPVLLAAHWLLHRENPAHENVFRALAGAQLALLFVIMASAGARMRLYQSEYGMTELRLYTTAFMCWLALVLLWFAFTVLVRGERERFACGALVAGLCVLGALHALNPDRFIVRTNASLAGAGRVFDAGYAASLSADAVP
ncbi:MAG: DUF4173 domain-containing protein, partial [Pyrinomonadaceae bacterium]